MARLAKAAGLIPLLALLAAGQMRLTLEQAAGRKAPDYLPVYSGESVVVKGTVSTLPMHLLFYSHVGIQDESGHGLVLESTPNQLSSAQPGDQVEVRGTISHRAGLVVLLVAGMQVTGRVRAPAPRNLNVAELQSFRHLGTLVTTEGRVIENGENAGGEYILIGPQNRPLKVFLPLTGRRSSPNLSRFDIGDKVRVTGLASQYCPMPPYDRWFQMMIADDEDVVLLEKRWRITPELFLSALVALVLALVLWWVREGRMAKQRSVMRSLYGLGEEVIGIHSPGEAVKRIAAVLPGILNVSGVRLYVYEKNTESLDPVSLAGEPRLPRLTVEVPENELPPAVVACFVNKALLAIPETRHSPFFRQSPGPVPRSVLYLPMSAESEVMGVLEIFDLRRSHDFSADEQVSTQHLANQIAIALKLMDRQSVREQLARSERLAAAAQLASGVATEVRTPLERIAELSGSEPAPEAPLRAIAEEAQKGLLMLARLAAITRPEQVETKSLDLNGLLRRLLDSKAEAFRQQGLTLQRMVTTDPAWIVGSQAQLERVFADLLAFAELTTLAAESKAMRIGSSVLANRLLVELACGLPSGDPRQERPLPLDELPGSSVTRSIVRGYNGELRCFGFAEGGCRIELEMPVAPAQPAEAVAKPAPRTTALTTLVVEPDFAARQELLHLLAGRDCRVIPTNGAEQAVDMARRMRFDLVFCSVRLPGLNWVEFFEEVRGRIGAFILMTEGFDPELAQLFPEGSGYLLAKPIQPAELDRLLAQIEPHLANTGQE